MNFPKKALLGSLLALSATSVFAVDTADLQVIGTIAPTACTPTFSGGAVVDYGLIPTASLSTTVKTDLAARPISYAIHCDAPIAIGVNWSDARAGTEIADPTSSPLQLFGLGTQGTTKIGLYRITQQTANVTGDGNPVDLIFRDSPTGTWATVPGTGIIMAHTVPRVAAFAATGTVVPGAFSDYAGTLSVIATIAPTSTLDLSTSITLDGLSTMTVNYL